VPKPEAARGRPDRPATHEDVKEILGDLDERKMLPILALRPTIADLEEALVWVAGDIDVFEPRPLKGIAGQIVTILTENEEEERQAR
jgi:hypothetical protein